MTFDEAWRQGEVEHQLFGRASLESVWLMLGHLQNLYQAVNQARRGYGNQRKGDTGND